MDVLSGNNPKFNLQRLDCTSDEYKFIKEFYDTTSGGSTYGVSYGSDAKFLIYKVNENNPTSAVYVKCNNLMLFHGTKVEGADGILKNGFENSKQGWHGEGVYMTDCGRVGLDYSEYNVFGSFKDHVYDYIEDHGCYYLKITNKNLFIFVNEIFGSEKLQTFEFDKTMEQEFIDTPLKHPFNKHIEKNSPQINKDDYKGDVEGRLYRNIAVEGASISDEFVADASVTIPRYLIHLTSKLDELNIVI